MVPFSTVAPDPVEGFHHLIPVGAYPFFHPGKDVWAKADMLTCIAFHRLDRVLLSGRHAAPSLQPGDFAAIQRAILAALVSHHGPAQPPQARPGAADAYLDGIMIQAHFGFLPFARGVC